MPKREDILSTRDVVYLVEMQDFAIQELGVDNARPKCLDRLLHGTNDGFLVREIARETALIWNSIYICATIQYEICLSVTHGFMTNYVDFWFSTFASSILTLAIAFELAWVLLL